MFTQTGACTGSTQAGGKRAKYSRPTRWINLGASLAINDAADKKQGKERSKRLRLRLVKGPKYEYHLSKTLAQAYSYDLRLLGGHHADISDEPCPGCEYY